MASYHCGRSQPLASRNTAPSSRWRAWNGLVRSGRGSSGRLQRVDDVVDLDEVLAVAGAATYSGASWCGSNRLTSHSCRSKLEQWPSTSHSATARPTPAEWVTQTASATQKPVDVRRLADQRHVVGGEGEQPVDALLDLRVAGRGQQQLGLPPRPRSKSSGVNGSTDGITSAVVEPERCPSASIGIGRWP